MLLRQVGAVREPPLLGAPLVRTAVDALAAGGGGSRTAPTRCTVGKNETLLSSRATQGTPEACDVFARQGPESDYQAKINESR